MLLILNKAHIFLKDGNFFILKEELLRIINKTNFHHNPHKLKYFFSRPFPFSKFINNISDKKRQLNRQSQIKSIYIFITFSGDSKTQDFKKHFDTIIEFNNLFFELNLSDHLTLNKIKKIMMNFKYILLFLSHIQSILLPIVKDRLQKNPLTIFMHQLHIILFIPINSKYLFYLKQYQFLILPLKLLPKNKIT